MLVILRNEWGNSLFCFFLWIIFDLLYCYNVSLENFCEYTFLIFFTSPFCWSMIFQLRAYEAIKSLTPPSSAIQKSPLASCLTSIGTKIADSPFASFRFTGIEILRAIESKWVKAPKAWWKNRWSSEAVKPLRDEFHISCALTSSCLDWTSFTLPRNNKK